MRGRALAATLALALAVAHAGGARAYPRRADWQTIHTEHFAIHFHGGEYLHATRAARILEDGYSRMVSWLRWYPDETVHVVLTDETDGANGFARILPYSQIGAFLAPPESDSNLNESSDWFVLLLDHELAHVLHMDSVRGLPAVINKVFGKTVAPNGAQPTWLIEGLAVLAESALTDGGRLRSSLFEMMIRNAALEDSLPDIDRLEGTATRWPGGTSAYLYGGNLMLYAAEHFGMEAVGELTTRYGGKLIPYSLNLTLTETAGVGWIDLYEQWRIWQTVEAEGYRARVLAAGRREGEPLTREGFHCGKPRHAPDGSGLVYFRSTVEGEPQLRWLPTAGGAERLLHEVHSRGGAAFTPDGRGLVFAQRERAGQDYRHDDLYYLDRATGVERRLTQGLRASQPDVSPDGRTVAVSLLRPGERLLGLIDLESGTLRLPTEDLALQSVDGPRWSPDGRWIVFSGWRQHGGRDLFLLDVERGAISALTSDRAQNIDPCFTPDGRAVIFASDRSSETYELYRYDLADGALTRLTRQVGGAFAPDVAPDGSSLVYVGYSASGYDLFRLPLDGADAGPAGVYVSEHPEPSRHEEEQGPLPGEPEPYSAWPSLLPRAWTPVLTNDGSHQTVGLQLAGQDALAHHIWALSLNYAFGGPGLSYDLGYVYSGIYPSFSLYTWRYGGRSTSRYWRDGIRQPYDVMRYGGSLYVSLPLSENLRYHRLLAGYRFQHTNVSFTRPDHFDPAELEPSFPADGNDASVIAGYSYSDVRSYPAGVGGQRGRSFTARISVYRPEIGSDFSRATASFRYTEYVGLPWWHHNLALKLSTALGVGDSGHRPLFSLGGVPEQDLSRAVTVGERLGSSYLRGYPPGSWVGDRYWLINAEYRLPIWNIERGLWTLPFYLGRIHAAVFYDVAEVDLRHFDFEEIRMGAGAEVRLDTTLAYYLPMTWRFGVAHGWSEDGETRFFFGVGGIY